MQFKIDENLPAEVAGTFRSAGYDAVSVIDQQLSGAADPDLAAVCRKERRALVTLDLDFSDIRTYPPSEFPGLIVLRPRCQAKSTVLALVKQLLPLLAVETLPGNLWILHETGLRIREGAANKGND